MVVVALWIPVPYFFIFNRAHGYGNLPFCCCAFYFISFSLRLCCIVARQREKKSIQPSEVSVKLTKMFWRLLYQRQCINGKKPFGILIWADLSPSQWTMCVAFNVCASLLFRPLLPCSNKSSPMSLCIINKPPKFFIFPFSERIWTIRQFVKSRFSTQTGNWLNVLSSSWFSLSLTLAVSRVDNNPQPLWTWI